MKKVAVAVFLLLACSHWLAAQTYDVVIHGGRVLDPETGLDAVRNVGINGSTIAAISQADLAGKQTIDATGLVVSPGFIDLHEHGQLAADYRLRAFDGVTSALEMEIGVPDVKTYLDERANGALINFGTTANYDLARAAAMHVEVPNGELVPNAGPATDNPATQAQIDAIKQRLDQQLGEGALGIGIGLQYVPGASRWEIIQIFQTAPLHRVPVFCHIRGAGAIDPGSIEAVQEMIGDSAMTGAPVQIVHINSSCMKDGPNCLQMIAGARARGLDVTTEAYPYTAGNTYINSALFNPGWQKQFGITYGDLAMQGTGERLTKERFDQLHADPTPHPILLYLNSEATVDKDILDPLVMIASDGEQGHPRIAGTFCKILARYVREQRSLSLMDAIRKMSLMPAQRLAASTPDAARKGRLQVGADADIDVFDPATVSDRATYSHPDLTSTGMKWVLVRGVPVISNGEMRNDVTPGRAILGHQ